jgi:CRP-like cAMP-binding protein/Zn-dependent protease
VTSPHPGLWGTVQERARAAPRAERDGLWERLKVLVEPSEHRPRLAPGVELKEFQLRWGNDYAMIANPTHTVHFRLEPEEAELVRLMDGRRTVKQIVVERFQESGSLELDRAADLVRELRVGSFLEPPFLDVEAAVKRAMDPSVLKEKARTFVRTLSIEWKEADRLARWLYHAGFKWFFKRWVQVLGGILSVAGLVGFFVAHGSGRFSLSGRSLALEALILLAMNYILTFLHELGHALVVIHHGRRILSAGFMVYFGSPAFFVDVSDALMMDRRKRMSQAFAGPFAELMVAGVASLALVAFPTAPLAQTLYKFAVLNYFIVFMNLIPLLELDGYFIASDLIQVPDLRPRSLAFIRFEMWRKLGRRERWNRQEFGLAVYGTVGVLFAAFSFYTGYFFWREIFGNLVSRMWNGGPVSRALLLVLVVLIAGPILRGAINLIRALGRRIRSLLRQARFRLERSWRVEAAEMIDALPLFEDVPEDVLSELAGRVRLRAVTPGQPVVRQGERPEAFYVVRRGHLQVVEENPEDGTERVLSTLGRGDSFGELALARSQPRSASVRALDEAELFEVDKGTFDQFLADMAQVPSFAPTLQAAAELRELPSFAHVRPDQLAELLEHGEWVNVAPGEVIIEEGDVGEDFYAVRSGQVEVLRNGEVVDVMGPGSYFGEIALLTDVPRTATVRARTPVRAFRLDREGFDRVVVESFRRGRLNPHIAVDRSQRH